MPRKSPAHSPTASTPLHSITEDSRPPLAVQTHNHEVPHVPHTDEAQLTAYLLGELSPEETAQVEAQLAVSAALRDELAGLQQTVTALEAALADRTPPAGPALDREKLHSLLQSAVVTSHEPTVVAPALLPTDPRSLAEATPAAAGWWLQLCWLWAGWWG